MTRPEEPASVVVVDHHDSYTWNLVHLVASVTGVLPTVLQHDEVTVRDLRDHTHVVLSPGPGHPAEPADFALGRGVFELGLPVLGVCLGMQALVTAYGGRVVAHEPAHGEVARVRHGGTGVFRDLPQDFRAVRYHSLQVAELPACLEVTATCSGPQPQDPRPVMGVRHTSLPLQGVQFHPESVLSEHGARIVATFLGRG